MTQQEQLTPADIINNQIEAVRAYLGTRQAKKDYAWARQCADQEVYLQDQRDRAAKDILELGYLLGMHHALQVAAPFAERADCMRYQDILDELNNVQPTR